MSGPRRIPPEISNGGGMADPGADGIVVRTAEDVTEARTLQSSADGELTWTNGDGVAGNPTPSFAGWLGDIAGDIETRENFDNLAFRGVIQARRLVDGDPVLVSLAEMSSSGATVLFGTAAQGRGALGVLIGSQVQAWDADLDALAALSGTGIARRTGAGTWTVGTLVTLAEMANLTGPTVIGRTTGTGAPAALTGVEAARVVSPVQTLTDAATVSWNAASGLRAKVTIAGNRTIDNPTNLVDGDEVELMVIIDATGGRTLDFGSDWEKPAIASGPNAVTTHRWRYDSALTPKLRLISDPWVTVPCTADTSDSTPADTEVTGLRYVGLDGATYLVRWYLEWDAAASTTGIQARVDGGANGTGSQWMMVQSTSATTPVIRLGPVGATNINGQSSTASVGPNAFVGEARITVSGGTTNIDMQFQTEIASSQVTVRTPSRVFVRRIA